MTDDPQTPQFPDNPAGRILGALSKPEIRDRIAALDVELQEQTKLRGELNDGVATVRWFLRTEILGTVETVLRFTKDFCIFAIIWLGLWGIDQLETAYPLHNERLGGLITEIHHWTVVVVYIWLCVMLLWDLVAERPRLRTIVGLVGRMLESWLRRQSRSRK